MKKTIILAYKNWNFRAGDKAESILRSLFKEEKIVSNAFPDIDITKRKYIGEAVDFFYYSPLELKNKSAEVILNEIKNDAEISNLNTVVLLHNGTSVREISFFNIPADSIIPTSEGVKLFFFSNGLGHSYRLLSSKGTMFKNVKIENLNQKNVEKELLDIWHKFFIEFENETNNIDHKIDS